MRGWFSVVASVAARRLARTLGVKAVRRTLSTHSSYPDAANCQPGLIWALRVLIPMPVLICNDRGESDGPA